MRSMLWVDAQTARKDLNFRENDTNIKHRMRAISSQKHLSRKRRGRNGSKDEASSSSDIRPSALIEV